MVKQLFGEIKSIDLIGGQITSRVEDKTGESGKSVDVLIPKAIIHGSVDHNNLGKLIIKSEIEDKKMTKEGDIVIKLSTPYDSCIITKNDEGLLVPSFCAIIRCLDNSINKGYLVAYLNSEACISQIRNLVVGSTIAILSTGTLKKIEIFIPDKDKQLVISNDYLNALRKEQLLNKIIELEYEKVNSEIYEIMEE